MDKIENWAKELVIAINTVQAVWEPNPAKLLCRYFGLILLYVLCAKVIEIMEGESGEKKMKRKKQKKNRKRHASVAVDKILNAYYGNLG